MASTKHKIGSKWTESLCECRKDFTEYADVCFWEFGNRVLYWSTLNEGNIFALGGYDTGMTPPHRCSPPFGNCPKGNSSTEAYIAAHHILLAHASVVQLYREKYQVSKLLKSVNEFVHFLSIILHLAIGLLVQYSSLSKPIFRQSLNLHLHFFCFVTHQLHRNIRQIFMVVKRMWCCRKHNRGS